PPSPPHRLPAHSRLRSCFICHCSSCSPLRCLTTARSCNPVSILPLHSPGSRYPSRPHPRPLK
ncbi:hypothetical protein FKP32DRAFT_1632401, partial [Trametes sanguinea]